MANVYADNSLSIGRTPLVKLNRTIEGGANVYAKIEARNPSFSVKCRLGAALIWDAEKKGILTADKEIVEPTSGNTGIALAFVAASRRFARPEFAVACQRRYCLSLPAPCHCDPQ